MEKKALFLGIDKRELDIIAADTTWVGAIFMDEVMNCVPDIVKPALSTCEIVVQETLFGNDGKPKTAKGGGI
jgi:hypothetical protein